MKKKARVLVIDDDIRVRKAIRLTLDDVGHEVVLAESGEEALSIFSPGAFDLIFLDLKMPGMDGVQTLRELRKKDERVTIYIITAFHSEFLDRLKEAGKDNIEFELLRKPVSGDVLCTLADIAAQRGKSP